MNLKFKHSFKFLYYISFIFSIQYALVVYVNSSFLEIKIGESLIGIVFTIASFLSIFALLQITHLLNRLGNYKSSILIILANVASLFLMGFGKSIFLIILGFILYNITNYSLMFSRDVFIEDVADHKAMGKTRGLFLTISNIAWVFAPIISGFIITRFSYSGVYILAALVSLSSIFLIFSSFNKFRDPKYSKISLLETFKKILGDKNLKKIFASEFLLRFFYSWMIIYTPIYLREYLNFSWSEIGIIFTIMLIPFVILDYPLGILSDKIGEKKILTLGFSVMVIATILMFFITTSNIFIWGIILFATRVGAATVEVMNESYFFKKINSSDTELISFFRNAFPASLVISPILATILLGFLSHQYLFLILGLILTIGIYLSLTLREIIHS
ncbi:MAG: MFS transporter [Candidatus Paceibacterota bacterium]